MNCTLEVGISLHWKSSRYLLGSTVQVSAFCQVIATLLAKETKQEDPTIHIF